MSDYYPDRWVMVEITNNGELIHKILASWYGGYLGANSWKLSSGNVEVIDEGEGYKIPQVSGSTYHCSKLTYGMSAYTMSVYQNFEDKVKDQDNLSIRILNETEILKFIVV